MDIKVKLLYKDMLSRIIPAKIRVGTLVVSKFYTVGFETITDEEYQKFKSKYKKNK